MTLQRILAIALLPSFVGSCVLQGYDSGVCQEWTLAGFKGQIDFCSEHVTYRACMPQKPPLSSNELLDHNMIEKDRWVQQQYELITGWYRTNHTSPAQLETMQDCLNSFKNFMCWYNFPRCSPLGVSLVMCRSVCENMMTSCGIAGDDLWRCGDPQFMNGRTMEKSTEVDTRGYKVWKRDFFPGQPFRDYRETDELEPIVVCTPSILGAASGLHGLASARAAFATALLASLLASYVAAGIY